MTGKSVRHMCASAFAAVCCLLCGSASGETASFVISERGKGSVPVWLKTPDAPSARYAAEEFSRYVGKLTGEKARIMEHRPADCDRASFKPFSAAICTVPASDAEAVAAKLAVKKLGAGIVAKLVSFDNGDGTVTLSADCGLIGMHVIVRQMG